MSAGTARRKFRRVEFSTGIDVYIVAVDGTWRMPCLMMDVADGGAQLLLKEPLRSNNVTEFLLSLSSAGGAFRRCERVWSHGDRMGVRFVKKFSKALMPKDRDERD
jgi:hypothetical protein